MDEQALGMPAPNTAILLGKPSEAQQSLTPTGALSALVTSDTRSDRAPICRGRDQGMIVPP